MDVYEEAWDSNFKQKQLDAKLMEARRASESKPKGRYEYEEPMSTISTKNPSLVMTPSSQNSEQVYSSNYEQPWDSKQKELEERFSRVGMSGGQVPPGSPPPPDFAPPPPPQTYEEAWDIRPHSKIISQVSCKYQLLYSVISLLWCVLAENEMFSSKVSISSVIVLVCINN